MSCLGLSAPKMHAFWRYGAHQPATAASADGGIGRHEVAGENHVVLAAAPEANVYILFSGPGAVIKLSDHT